MRWILSNGFLLFFSFQAFADVNYLRLYFMPSSPVRIEWDNPKNLVDSTIAAGFSNRNHPISHTTVELNCPDIGVHFHAGAVSADKNTSMKLLFEEKIGLSIMAGAWPGRLETQPEILDSLNYRGVRNGMLSAATFTINASTCSRLNDYYKGMESRSGSRFYGFAARPRRHEGAGCSAFVASFLEVGGILTPEIRSAWTTQVKVPLSLMTTLGTGVPSTVQDLIAHPDAAKWSDSLAPHMNITVYDPDRMHDWVLANVKKPDLNDPTLTGVYPKIRAIKMDKSAVPTPADPIFTGEPELRTTAPGFVVRKNIHFLDNGSFELPPD